MNRQEEKQLFKLSEMKAANFRLNDLNVVAIDVPKRVRITCEEMTIEKNIISRIEVYKFESDDSSLIFVEFYMGNVKLAQMLADKDVTLIKSYRETVNGEIELTDITVRNARDYDYNG